MSGKGRCNCPQKQAGKKKLGQFHSGSRVLDCWLQNGDNLRLNGGLRWDWAIPAKVWAQCIVKTVHNADAARGLPYDKMATTRETNDTMFTVVYERDPNEYII